MEATLIGWEEVSFERVQGTSLDPCPPCTLGLLSLSAGLQAPGLCAERAGGLSLCPCSAPL